MADRDVHGMTLRGSAQAESKLTETDVVRIRKLLRSGAKYTEIAEEFGIGKSTVYRIARGTHWAHVPDELAPGEKPRRLGVARGEQCRATKLTEIDVVTIRARFAAGEFQWEIGRDYGVTQSAISDIVRGKNWKHVVDDEPEPS